jgi:hypothetical protein
VLAVLAGQIKPVQAMQPQDQIPFFQPLHLLAAV